MKVNLICIGAQKAGTTTLFDLLKKHPDITFSRFKEVHFFNTAKYHKGVEYYHGLFDKNKNKYYADITPMYIAHPQVAKRIFQYNPETKIIAILRHPIERAYSHYQMHVRNGDEKRTFEQCIQDEMIVLENGLNENNFTGYLARGLYSQQLKRYFQLFDIGNIKIVLFEQLVLEQKQTFSEILNFLDLPNIELGDQVKSNEHYKPKLLFFHYLFHRIPFTTRQRILLYIPKYVKRTAREMTRTQAEKQPISTSAYQQLASFYQCEIIELEKTTQLDLSAWKTR